MEEEATLKKTASDAGSKKQVNFSKSEQTKWECMNLAPSIIPLSLYH
jgi:hypothetical protein